MIAVHHHQHGLGVGFAELGHDSGDIVSRDIPTKAEVAQLHRETGAIEVDPFGPDDEGHIMAA